MNNLKFVVSEIHFLIKEQIETLVCGGIHNGLLSGSNCRYFHEAQVNGALLMEQLRISEDPQHLLVFHQPLGTLVGCLRNN